MPFLRFMSLNENFPMPLPPYEDGVQPVHLDVELELARSDVPMFISQRSDSLRWFLAGGGQESAFHRHWDHVLGYLRWFEAGIAATTLHGACGQTFYLVGGRKR